MPGPALVTQIVSVTFAPALMFVDGTEALSARSAEDGLTRKLPCEMSKKIFDAARTWIRAEAVEMFGNKTNAAPLFGMLVQRVYGNVWPPSTDNKMFTVIAVMGEFVVPATSQITVRRPDHDTPAAGDVTLNGAVPGVTITCASVLATPPPS